MPLTALAPGVARELRAAGLTYSEARQTEGVLPPGYHHLRRSAVIAGAQEFAGAAQACSAGRRTCRRPFAWRRRRPQPDRARSGCWAWGQEQSR